MQGLLLTSQPLLRVFLLEPGALLFGLLLMLMSASLVLVFILKKLPALIYPFLGIMLILFLTLVSILSFDLIGSVTRVYVDNTSAPISELFSTHRWLLMQIPILLSFVTLILGWFCKNDLTENHAQEYVTAMQVSVAVTFLTILLIGLESLI